VPDSIERYSGYTCWRSVVDDVPESLVGDEASETWGAGKRFGIVPLINNRVYWYATLDVARRDPRISSYTLTDIQQLFRHFHAPVSAILDRSSNKSLLLNDICDFKPLRQYAFGNVALLGDAAHATTPNLGQGACMAIEDAVVLANCMGKVEDPLKAFQLYETTRIDRATRIVNASYALGKVAQIQNPILVSLRNAVLRNTPESIAEKQLRFLYDISFN
jgi:2-polyprenyl-6-methoxyphenol hydroxylase-like FAD-dependent oxidoreductase